jgi:hypothetical protein
LENKQTQEELGQPACGMNYIQQSCRMSFVKLAAGSVLSETEVEIPPAPLFPKHSRQAKVCKLMKLN